MTLTFVNSQLCMIVEDACRDFCSKSEGEVHDSIDSGPPGAAAQDGQQMVNFAGNNHDIVMLGRMDYRAPSAVDTLQQLGRTMNHDNYRDKTRIVGADDMLENSKHEAITLLKPIHFRMVLETCGRPISQFDHPQDVVRAALDSVKGMSTTKSF